MKKYTNEEIIAKFKNVHGDLYDYSKILYEGKFIKVIIICKLHGDFEQSPHGHTHGQGCPKCAKRFMDTPYFIEKSKQIHNNLYDYSESVFIHSKTPINIICKIHGKFMQTPDSHLRGCGCFKCKGSNKKTTIEFINDANKVHQNTYDYSQSIYTGINKKINIICNKHGVFPQRAVHHLNGIGCPTCSESKGEKEIRNFLIKNNIQFISQYKFDDCKHKKKLYFDFYLPQLSICIEFDGLQHKLPIKFFGGDNGLKIRQERDDIKNQYCINNNIKLIRIEQIHLKDIESVLFDFLI